MSERDVLPDAHYRSLYPPSEYLAADEIPVGRDIVVRIEAVVLNDMPIEGSSKREMKPVVKFEGRTKRWPLPKTCAKVLARLYGEKPKQDWVGKSITIYRTTTKLKGETVPCIRIRPTAPKAAAKGAAQREPDPTGDGPPPDEVQQEAQP